MKDKTTPIASTEPKSKHSYQELERKNKRLTKELRYETREIANTSIVEYIECYYNRKRRHSAINYMIPAEFEKVGSVA